MPNQTVGLSSSVLFLLIGSGSTGFQVDFPWIELCDFIYYYYFFAYKSMITIVLEL